jgi:hypothetical protein
MLLGYVVAPSSNSSSTDVQPHVSAGVCFPLLEPSEIEHKHAPQLCGNLNWRSPISHRRRFLHRDCSGHVTTSTRIPILSP